jgi:hypothetical protein
MPVQLRQISDVIAAQTKNVTSGVGGVGKILLVCIHGVAIQIDCGCQFKSGSHCTEAESSNTGK